MGIMETTDCTVIPSTRSLGVLSRASRDTLHQFQDSVRTPLAAFFSILLKAFFPGRPTQNFNELGQAGCFDGIARFGIDGQEILDHA